MQTDSITVRLLGGFSLRFGDRDLSSLPPQAVSLLAYLIVHRDRPQTRDLLAGRFWSELPEDRARKRLSNCLWQIKSGLAAAGMPELVTARSATIEFSSRHPVEVDAEEFEATVVALERELHNRQLRGLVADRLIDVVASYPGDFLAGHYHEWIEPERDRIRESYFSALTHLVALYKSRSQYDIALRFAHLLVNQEPLREDLHCEVMRLHALLDQVGAAERQFEVCRRTLQAELGVEPSGETVALIERIRTDAPSGLQLSAVQDRSGSALIGRDQEMSVLLGRAEELLSGSGGVVLVEGEPGIGKTRLIRELMEAADWRGVRVLHAGHTELSRMQPYAALGEALGPSATGLRGDHLVEVVDRVWLQTAVEVLPGLARLVDGSGPSRPLRPEEEPTRISEALARIILAQGGLGPCLLVLEDVHWCDDDSMQVLVQLGSRLARSGVLLCLTYRRFEAEQSDSVWTGIGKLEALSSGSRLVLGPLGRSEVRELITSQLGPGGLPVGALGQLVELTRGNPLFVLEAVRDPIGLMAEHPDEAPTDTELRLPAAVIRSLEARVAAMPLAARRAVEVLSALAEPATASLVARIEGTDRRAAVEALAVTTDLGFVVDDDEGRCRFSHDQTRRLVYETITAARRRDIHDRVYQALEQVDGSSPGQLAHHARLAGRMSETRRRHLEAARQALQVNAYRTAADHFGQADDAAQELRIDLADRAEDLLAYEATLDVLGRRAEQAMLLKSLEEVQLPPEQELELARRNVWLLINSDEVDRAVQMANRAIGRAEQSGLPTGPLLTAIAMARYRAGQLREALDTATQALDAATAPSQRISAETILGKALVDLLKHDEGKRHLSRAADEAVEIGDDRARIEALSYMAVADFGLGRFRVAEAEVTEAIELSRAIGYRWGEGSNLVNLGALHTAQGHGGQALEVFASAGDIVGSLGHGLIEAVIKHNLADLHHLLLGDDDEAARLASSAAVYFRSVGDQPNECLAMVVLSSIDLRHGRRRLCRRRLNDLLSRTRDNGDAWGEMAVRQVLAALERAAGHHRQAEAHLSEILDRGDHSMDIVVPNILADRATALLALGDRTGAEADVDRALAMNRAGSDRAHVTAWLCAKVLAELGRDEDSVEQFRMAFEMLMASLAGLPAETQALSRSAIPEHASILEEYCRRFPLTARVTLPAEEAPLGRPLRPDELVDVTWTVSDPSDWASGSAADRRRDGLVRMVSEAQAQGASARIADLADALTVSERTIKRDLAGLRRLGIHLKTRKPS